MKKILSLFLFLSVNTFSQDFSYKIKVANITNIQEAKLLTDPIRFKFNSFPIFNDTTDKFEFNSTSNITQIELVTLLSQHGYTLIKFEKSMRMQCNETEIKDK